MAVQEKGKMYIELRQILARQPGPELTEQLSEYKRSIKQKEWLHIEPTRIFLSVMLILKIEMIKPIR